MRPLTSAAIERYKPGPTRRVIRDGGARSLFLVISPAGHKSWMMRFRRPGSGKPGKIVLGPLHMSDEPPGEPTIGMPLTLAGARVLAAQVLQKRAQGRDPIADHKAKQQRKRAAEGEGANTFGAAAREFVEKHASRRVRRWKEQARLLGFQPTASGLEVMPGGLVARWGNRQIAEIDGHDIHAVVADTRERGAAGLERRSDGPTESRARAMLSVLSRMFRWLVEHRRVETNPCASVHRPETPRARDRVLTNAEIARFWEASNAIGGLFAAVLRLLLLTGCRLNEIAGLRWGELSEDGNSITIPCSRTKNGRPHVVPLAPTAREILAGVPRFEGCQLVFSTNGLRPISGWSKAKRRLDAAMGATPPWRIHDLRRTVVTDMAELGVRPDVIEMVVNHISGHRGGVAGIYNRSELLTERRAALERWSAHVAGLVGHGTDHALKLNQRQVGAA
jgi:integrase